MPRPRRSLADRLGVYRRDGRVRFGRAPYITPEQWRKIETRQQTRLRRLLQWLGLTYAPDRTRVVRPWLFGKATRTTD